MGFIEKTIMMIIPGLLPVVIAGIVIIYIALYSKDTICTTPYIYHLVPFSDYGFQSNLHKAKKHAISIAYNCIYTEVLDGPGPDDWESKVEWAKRTASDPMQLARSVKENTPGLLSNLIRLKDGTCGLDLSRVRS